MNTPPTSQSNGAVTTEPLSHSHTTTTDERPPVKPSQAARALRVRRETIHRWIRDGKLEVVHEPNAQGRPVRLIPQSEVDRLIQDGARGPSQVDVTSEDHSATEPQPPGHDELRVQLELAQHTASTLAAQMDVVRAQVDAAVQALDTEPEGGWWSARKASKTRAAIAETALRQLSAIPPAD